MPIDHSEELNFMYFKRRLLMACCVSALLSAVAGGAQAGLNPVDENTAVDLTGTVSMSHQQWWPAVCLAT